MYRMIDRQTRMTDKRLKIADLQTHNVSRLTDFVPDLQVEKVGFQGLLSPPGIFIFYFKEFRCRKDKKKIRPAK